MYIGRVRKCVLIEGIFRLRLLTEPGILTLIQIYSLNVLKSTFSGCKTFFLSIWATYLLQLSPLWYSCFRCITLIELLNWPCYSSLKSIVHGIRRRRIILRLLIARHQFRISKPGCIITLIWIPALLEITAVLIKPHVFPCTKYLAIIIRISALIMKDP